MLAAVVQFGAGADKDANLADACAGVERAAEAGARFVALPEYFLCLADPKTMRAAAEPIPGPASGRMSELARRLAITLLAGSIPERAGTDKIHNTSLLFGPDGALLARYRKIHLFDVAMEGRLTFCESSFVAAGSELVVADTAIGRLGLSTCYDLRFGELYRRLTDEGAQVIAVPSAFMEATGRDHWEPLLRARAIENQVYVVAPNQQGEKVPGLCTHGRSMIVDPWGTVLATCADGPGFALAAIERDRLLRLRRELPALEHRRGVEQWPVRRHEV